MMEISKLYSNDTSNTPIALFVFLCVALITIVLIVAICMVKKSRDKKVLASSRYIEDIKKLNKGYTFEKFQKSNDSKNFVLNSKRQFDTFDFNKKANEYIRENLNYFNSIIEKININKRKYGEYKEDLSKIHVTSNKDIAKAYRMSLASYNKREIKFGKTLFKHPQVTYTVKISWSYTSPAGRKSYRNFRTYSLDDIINIVNQQSSTNNKASVRRVRCVKNGEQNVKTQQANAFDDGIEEVE